VTLRHERYTLRMPRHLVRALPFSSPSRYLDWSLADDTRKLSATEHSRHRDRALGISIARRADRSLVARAKGGRVRGRQWMRSRRSTRPPLRSGPAEDNLVSMAEGTPRERRAPASLRGFRQGKRCPLSLAALDSSPAGSGGAGGPVVGKTKTPHPLRCAKGPLPAGRGEGASRQ
jgi:hypothetical protein